MVLKVFFKYISRIFFLKYVFIFRNRLGLIICPSRELAKQTFDIINHYITYLEHANYPRLRSCLAIGGIPVFESLDVIKRY